MHHVRSGAQTKAHGPQNVFSDRSNGGSIPSDTSVLQKNIEQTASSVPSDGKTAVDDENEKQVEKISVISRFWKSCKSIALSSYLNILLVLVPVGIAAKFAKLDPGIVFGLNAAAIIPLAGLLSYATESVAQRMGDTVGALMNVTFGNAVELIIFIIALQKDEIRIVQASLLGSILANLLLILGMCFLIGGLRYLEQLYNSKVTQLSACLLSLSVMSLLLPTAFHASFKDSQELKANSAVLKVSRGTSVVLLLVYGMYLLFQLKSHAYMYQSTPQHIIDEESAPGPVAAWMEHASGNFSSSGSDSDVSHISHFTTTTRRVRKLIRRRSSRNQSKSSYASSVLHESLNSPGLKKKASYSTITVSPHDLEANDRETFPNVRITDASNTPIDDSKTPSPKLRRVSIAENDEHRRRSYTNAKRRRSKQNSISSSSEKSRGNICDQERANFQNTIEEKDKESEPEPEPEPESSPSIPIKTELQKTVTSPEENSGLKRPFNLRIITLPTIPKSLSQNIFTHPFPEENDPRNEVVPNIRYGVRRTNSLPNDLNVPHSGNIRKRLPADVAPMEFQNVAPCSPCVPEKHQNISRTTSVFLLLISTGLVALCAEFMVGSINAVVKNDSGLSEAFIGLIILPIVGNAAEHVTAVTVAAKNKMDLAIGVAIGSSIQIALFVTPFVVLLGWCMDKELSLFFTLFETVSLFVSAFIVNFLVLDGRSNYLEGALLCAAYIMIAVAAFFYPSVQESNSLGGNNASPEIIRRAGVLLGFI